MPDPMTVTIKDLSAAYEALGLDPERFEQTKSFCATGTAVTVVRVRELDNGRIHATADGEVLTETVTIAVEFDPELAPAVAVFPHPNGAAN